MFFEESGAHCPACQRMVLMRRCQKRSTFVPGCASGFCVIASIVALVALPSLSALATILILFVLGWGVIQVSQAEGRYHPWRCTICGRSSEDVALEARQAQEVKRQAEKDAEQKKQVEQERFIDAATKETAASTQLSTARRLLAEGDQQGALMHVHRILQSYRETKAAQEAKKLLEEIRT
jgi:hypothetical protein